MSAIAMTMHQRHSSSFVVMFRSSSSVQNALALLVGCLLCVGSFHWLMQAGNEIERHMHWRTRNRDGKATIVAGGGGARLSVGDETDQERA